MAEEKEGIMNNPVILVIIVIIVTIVILWFTNGFGLFAGNGGVAPTKQTSVSEQNLDQGNETQKSRADRMDEEDRKNFRPR